MSENKDSGSGSGQASPTPSGTAPSPGRASDPAIIGQQLARMGVDASELSGLTGENLASYALARPDSRLSVGDLNRIALGLLQLSASGEKPDLRASAGILASLISLNAPKPKTGDKPKTPQRDLSGYLARSSKGLPGAPPKRTIDVQAEPSDDKP